MKVSMPPVASEIAQTDWAALKAGRPNAESGLLFSPE